MTRAWHISELRAAHTHSSGHREQVVSSEKCGCFYCLAVFAPSEIDDWVDVGDPEPVTALCPRCGIDSVLGDASGLPVADARFLKAMEKHWFGSP